MIFPTQDKDNSNNNTKVKKCIAIIKRKTMRQKQFTVYRYQIQYAIWTKTSLAVLSYFDSTEDCPSRNVFQKKNNSSEISDSLEMKGS